jgi:hypothetical protein
MHPGPELFARYAYPPNQLGFCGVEFDPDGLSRWARTFTGAWPYLELIAGETGIADPLDRRVVEAYWVGGDLLRRVPLRAVGDSMDDRFRRRAGRQGFSMVAENVLAGGVPHHSFHVFGVYPWIGLLGLTPQALTVLDRCRIRWGKVVAVQGDRVVVRSRPLRWDGARLFEAGEEQEAVTCTFDPPGVGDWVSLHWDWVCDRLDAGQLASLRYWSGRQLRIANVRLGGGQAAEIGPTLIP